MALVTKTFADGNPLPASDLNTYVSGVLQSLINPPSCKAVRTSTMGVATATLTAVPFQSELWDTNSMHDNFTNPSRITVPIAGLYLCSWGIRMGPITVTNQYNLHRLHRNGALVVETFQHGLTSTMAYTELTGTDVVKCAAGDYLEVAVYHNQGSSVNIDMGFPPFLSVTWIGNG